MKLSYKRLLKAFFMASVISVILGCSGAVPGQSPTLEFRTAYPLEVAFQRAMAQAKYCWSTDANLPILGSVAINGKSAEVRAMGEFGRRAFGRVDIEAIDDKSSFVRVAVIGVDAWDNTSLYAMKAAIDYGVPSCTNYFPSDATPPKKR